MHRQVSSIFFLFEMFAGYLQGCGGFMRLVGVGALGRRNICETIRGILRLI